MYQLHHQLAKDLAAERLREAERQRLAAAIAAPRRRSVRRFLGLAPLLRRTDAGRLSMPPTAPVRSGSYDG
jgi:hypothetical protein